jgi:hypothetical protein
MIRDLEPWRAELAEQGWAALRYDPLMDLLALANPLGRAVPSKRGGLLIDRLTPKAAETAHSRSLSGRYGLGEFPFHTDQAKEYVPPRYIVLRLAAGSTSSTPTLLKDTYRFNLADTDWLSLHRDVAIVDGGRGRFLSPIINDSLVGGHLVVRYDADCMNPAHPRFSRAWGIMNAAITESSMIEIQWEPGLVLFLDNWRMLHARAKSASSDVGSRVLERILLESEGV